MHDLTLKDILRLARLLEQIEKPSIEDRILLGKLLELSQRRRAELRSKPNA